MDWLKRLKQENSSTPDPLQIAEEFDRQKWAKEIERVICAACKQFTGSIIGWMKEKRPDLFRRMKKAEKDIDGAYGQKDAPRLKAALTEFAGVLELASKERH